MIDLLTPRVWEDITRAALQSHRPARVAVAYFGDTGDRLLPLKEGSSLVVDATIPTLAVGSTSPAALERLRRRGVDIYSAQYLHAKVYAFDKIAFVGSANVSRRSELTLIEAVLRIDAGPAVTSARRFVESLCITKLTAGDLAELARFYKPPRVPTPHPRQRDYATLLMELTLEQGLGRETQVQPPKAVWERYFDMPFDWEKLPTLSLINESVSPDLITKRKVVKHHHNYTIELAGTELPRPAILQMRRLSRNKYLYRVHRPADSTFSYVDALLNRRNPWWGGGRRWIMV